VQLHHVVLEIRLTTTRRRAQLTLEHRLLAGMYQLVGLYTETIIHTSSQDTPMLFNHELMIMKKKNQ